MEKETNIVSKKDEFMLIFEVINGNPNGDPDNDGAPRVDVQTRHGIVTDVCQKRRVRDYIALKRGGEPGFDILINSDKTLNEKNTEAFIAENLPLNLEDKAKKCDVMKARSYMLRRYYDARVLGAVMSTGKDRCGTAKGPVKITMARSVSPVYVEDLTITRKARTTEERQKTGDTEFGRKYIIPYGLYVAKGFVSPADAEKTGMTEEDLDLFYEALINMFDYFRSAASGEMYTRKLLVFRHDSPLGGPRAYDLFNKVSIKEKVKYPREFSDYEITIDRNMPEGVELIEML